MSDSFYDLASINVAQTSIAPRVSVVPGAQTGTPAPCPAPGASTTVGFGCPAPTLGNDGDSYIDGTTGHVWQRSSGLWTNSGMVIGQGTQTSQVAALSDTAGNTLTDNDGVPLIIDGSLSSIQYAVALTDNDGNALTDNLGNLLVTG
jgi:hypothetical protein